MQLSVQKRKGIGMGWTFYSKPKDVKAELMRLCTFENVEAGVKSEALECKIVNLVEGYLAVRYRKGEQDYVYAAVFMLSYNGEAGYEFGYKDMTETCGPNISNCPESILKRLSPVEMVCDYAEGQKYAREWRERCWAKIAQRKLALKVTEGAIVKFAVPYKIGAEVVDTFVCRHIAGCKTFVSVDGRFGPYRLQNWRKRSIAEINGFKV